MQSDDFSSAALAHSGSMQQLYQGTVRAIGWGPSSFSASTCFTNPTSRACLSCAELHLQRSLICLASALERRIPRLGGKTFSKMNEVVGLSRVWWFHSSSCSLAVTALVLNYTYIYIYNIWHASLSRTTYRTAL